jgi:hypothetical protein
VIDSATLARSNLAAEIMLSGDPVMQYALFSIPIRPEKTDVARAFLTELEGSRKSAYAQSERRLNVSKELWAIQHTPAGDQFVVFFESEDVGAVVSSFVASQDEFDLWFKGQVLDATGIDMTQLPPGPLSEVLSVYQA